MCIMRINTIYMSQGQLLDAPAQAVGALFRVIRNVKNIESLTSQALSYNRARELVLTALTEVGEDAKQFGTHSFRSGGATAASNAGVSHSLLKSHGRWKSDCAKDRYIRSDLVNKLRVTQCLGL